MNQSSVAMIAARNNAIIKLHIQAEYGPQLQIQAIYGTRRSNPSYTQNRTNSLLNRNYKDHSLGRLGTQSRCTL
jgi:hypothetical protein